MRTVRALVLAGLLAGCGQSEDAPAPAPRTASMPRPGVYAGIFPCADCTGIEATLWLRPDGRFFIRRSYPDDGVAGLVVYNSGRWRWERADGEIVLDGAGPDQVLRRLDSERLELETYSPIEHVLSRLEPAPAFHDRFEIGAVAIQVGRDYVVTQCSTGLEAPLTGGDDFATFRQRFRNVGGGGGPIYVEFEGRFAWTESGAPEALEVDRFLTIKPGRGC